MPDIRPDPEHEAVIASQARHLVVTAPPGTGKTFLSVRLAGQLAPDLPVGACVLLLTFSTQARTQLEREAARQLDPETRRRVEVTNYHRFFWRGVLAYRRALGLPMQLDVGSRGRRKQALRQVDEGVAQALDRHVGLLEALAEHAFAEFRDRRTPDDEVLKRLLAVVEDEHHAGRLVFDDLGALFWKLLERFPAVDEAYRSRYPVVIADEHQDASALQDAIVRHFGHDRMVIFADPMQLIHEFRGASHTRIEKHVAECDDRIVLHTPHRWHGNDIVARWLLAVRSRLQGRTAACQPPAELTIEQSPAGRGFNGMKPRVKDAVSRAFADGVNTVAVIARDNARVGALRSYLCRQRQFPRQIGTEDFEDARQDIEELPGLSEPRAVARHAMTRLADLVPTLDPAVEKQVNRRLQPDGIKLSGAGAKAGPILRALTPIYEVGAGTYFTSLVAALDACTADGHYLPRREAVHALRVTADGLKGQPPDLELAIDCYSAAVLAASNMAPRTDRGLFVMTAHQAKGKEFEAVVLADATARFWRDDDEHRRLFYVVITRATRSWTVVAPDQGASPLIRFLLDP